MKIIWELWQYWIELEMSTADTADKTDSPPVASNEDIANDVIYEKYKDLVMKSNANSMFIVIKSMFYS